VIVPRAARRLNMPKFSNAASWATTHEREIGPQFAQDFNFWTPLSIEGRV
jgi:hypothetical protein